jgi:hypothetical protein
VAGQDFHTPASDRLAEEVLRMSLREFLPHDERYFDCFDKFEYLLALAHADQSPRPGGFWGPVGRFGWRQRRRRESVYDEVEREAREAGSAWSFLSTGLFDGSPERFEEVRDGYRAAVLSQLTW